MPVPAQPSPAPPWPQRADHWTLARRVLHFGPLPLLMGIVNVTPDSFSDGGRFFDPGKAIGHALELIQHGADILDIGGESTRPYSEPVAADEEARRVVPVIEGLAGRIRIPISIDTSKPDVAKLALAAGAEIINDVSGLADERMVALALETRAGVCVMHMQGTPGTMQDDPRYHDVVGDIREYLRGRRDALEAAGIPRDRIVLDPGIGFGKTHQHNLELLANCGRLHDLSCPLLVGHSRKAFIAKVIGDREADRTPGTIGVALALARQGVQILRIHDVRPVHEALQLFAAVGGTDGTAERLDSESAT